MQATFTTSDFGDEAASAAAAGGSPKLAEEAHLYGDVVLEHPGQERLALYDDLPFLVLALCAEAPREVERTGAATASLIDWPNMLSLVTEGDEIHLTGEHGEDARYPRAEMLAALRGCAGRFVDFLKTLSEHHPQFAYKAEQIRSALAGG